MIDDESRQILSRLVASQRTAALGTIDADGGPLVSVVPYVVDPDDTPTFLLHVSRLAQHTRGLLEDGRIGLLIAKPDRGTGHPQAMARVSIRGRATPIPLDDPSHEPASARYLSRFPNSAVSFSHGDFVLVRIHPASARFIAGFGRILDLDADDLSACLSMEEAGGRQGLP